MGQNTSNSFSDPLERALTYYQLGTILSDYYQQQLTDAQAAELLDTIIHESIHYTLPPTDPRTVDKSGKGYPYDEAKKLTSPVLIRKLNKQRKQCPCGS
jgi:hypothetical protein